MKYQIINAAISLNGNNILDEINFLITENSHIGLVGKNGAGKTTLLKSLINNELLEEGIEDEPFKIIKIGNFSIGYLEQITFNDETRNLKEEIELSYKEIIDVSLKLDKLVVQMENDTSEKTIKLYTELLDKFEKLGGYTYQKEYETMLKRFGFTKEDKNKKIGDFSGGERTKIAFLKLLLSKPDILFLDEPTNHLDIEAIIWLENYLKNYKKAFVVVSHDRMFLNNIVNTIYDISYKRVTKYVGNYESFERQRKENYEKNLKDYERQQKEIARLRSLYEKFIFKPSKSSMALSKLHMIERMELIEKPRRIDEKTFKMKLNKMERSGKMVLTCKDLVIGYNNSLGKINLEINEGNKIGIIGANGTGKSTLLKTINGLIKPLSGSVTYGYHVNIGYFDQNLKMNDENNTILEEFKSVYKMILDSEAKSALGAFLFSGEDVNKKVSVLSGGEKVRLELCKLLYAKPNFLVLDEPTNHMDLIGKNQLENILETYKGTIIFVSHDRYFIKKIASSLIVFENNEIKHYNYNYEDYLAKYKALEDKEKKNTNYTKINKKDNNNELKKALNKIEKEITKLEEKKKLLNEELFNPDNYNNFQKCRELKENIDKISLELEDLENEWVKLSEEM